MRYRALWAGIAAALLTACGSCGPGKGDYAAFAKGNNAFALDLYGKLREEEGNLFFSPLSLSSALAMTYGGARGATAAEMSKVMHFGVPQKDLPAAFYALDYHLEENRGEANRLANANGLCLTGGDVAGDFRKMLREYYEAEIFSGDLKKINDWVKEKTEGKIEQILKSLSRDSLCVLLNAIYFKGVWASRFEKRDTRDSDFTLADGKKIKVPMMYQDGKFRMVVRDGFKTIELPYKGDTLTMTVLLPDRHDGLSELEKSLSVEMLGEVLGHLDAVPSSKILTYLPRFRFKTKLMDMNKALRELGMKLAFEQEGADFSGMGGKKGDFWISQVKHKAFVEVNEKGTEAAAVTAVWTKFVSAHEPPSFDANHPFLFLIREKKTGTMLFMGRLMDPSK